MYDSNRLRKIIVLGLLICAIHLAGEDKTAPQGVNELLLERARNGEAQAQLEAGFAFYRLNNPVRAAYWFSRAASQNSAPAQYNMGRCYLDGYGVKKNIHQAFEYFKSAAAQNLPPAQLEAAKLYLSGIAAVPEHTPALNAVAPDEKAAFERVTRGGLPPFLEKEADPENAFSLLYFKRLVFYRHFSECTVALDPKDDKEIVFEKMIRAIEEA